MGLNASFLQFGPKVASFFREATSVYTAMAESGEPPSPDILAMLVLAKMEDWNPEVKGIRVLDDETKAAGARFLSGIVCSVGIQAAQRRAS